MIKKVLVITYSQTGQLDQIVDRILLPFSSEVEVFRAKIQPEPAFPFPWRGISFWDAMPESVSCVPSAVKPLQIDTAIEYDLVIIGYPIWFLSPPIPLTSFLHTPEASMLLKGKPVVTVIGSRNMWISAQEDIKKMILDNEGILVGNIALRDKNPNLISVVTIIYWLTQGKKDRYLGFFPKPGIADADIQAASRFGAPILKALQHNDWSPLQASLLEAGAVDLVPSIISMETKAKHIFKFWARFVLKKGGPGNPARIPRLKMFKYYLLFVIFAVSPIASGVYYLTYPVFRGRIKRNLDYYRKLNYKHKEK